MKLLRFTAVLLAALVSAPLVANAASLDLFTASGGGNTFSFTLPASPTNGVLDPNYSNNAFYIDNVAVDFNGTTSLLRVEFFEPVNFGGLNLDNNGTSTLFHGIELFGAQLFTGSPASPTFALGTFPLTKNEDTSYSLTISSAAAPEPSSLMLLGTGVAGLCGFVRRRFATA